MDWCTEAFGEEIYAIPLGCFDDPSISELDVSVWNCFLPDWFSPLSSADTQQEKQGDSIEEMKEGLRAMGKI